MHQTLIDLQEDYDELETLTQSVKSKISQFKKHLKEHPEFYRPTVHDYLQSKAESLEDMCSQLIIQIPSKQAIRSFTTEDIQENIDKKREYKHILRIIHSETGCLLTSGDWQSPTFENTGISLAGKETGKIQGQETDYKRDWHADGSSFEAQFRKEYIDSGMHLVPGVFTTSSGMSAFTTILEHLKLRSKIKGPILVGQSIYFENRWLVEQAFPGQVTVFNEFDTEEALEIMKQIKPKIVFVDSLSNSGDIRVPDLKTLLRKGSKILPFRTVFVIDNSALATSFHPLKHLSILNHIRLFVIESLNKYYQFGMDRVTGGVVWCSPLEAFLFHKTRVHLGTILSDTSVCTLPSPNRKLLDKRLARFQRNATYIAETLDKYLNTHPNSIFSHIVYPGLPNHPSYLWTQSNSFHGSFFVLGFHPLHQKVSTYQRVVKQVIQTAKKCNIDMVSGTSFGMDTTRIYLTARYADRDTTPFVRISVGTETLDEVEKIIQVFIKVFSTHS